MLSSIHTLATDATHVWDSRERCILVRRKHDWFNYSRLRIGFTNTESLDWSSERLVEYAYTERHGGSYKIRCDWQDTLKVYVIDLRKNEPLAKQLPE